MIPLSPRESRNRRRPGITLLEVLIACGLLIIGLSTMASLLPAAGSRLAQANIEDRAGVLVANALAELSNRGLLDADAFPADNPGLDGTVRALVIGRVLSRLPQFPEMQPANREPLLAGPPPEALARCGSPRTFLLEDELVYGEPRLASTPVNAFTKVADEVGPRRFREAICWGAMISPKSLPPTPGGLARLAIAIFRKDGGDDQVMPVTLTRRSTHYEAVGLLGDDSLLGACSWVLALPPTGSSTAPRWFQIISSWRFPPPAASTPRIIFHDQQGFQAFTGTSAADTKTTVLAFEGLVRVDERDVRLD